MTISPPLAIRRVAPADAAAIAAIYNHYVMRSTATFEVTPVSVADMVRRIAGIAAAWPYHVGLCGDTVVGYCYAHPWKERQAFCHTLETTVYLHPEAVGHGYGLALMARLIADCRQHGYRMLIACITGENAASRALHARLGFTQASHFRAVGHKMGRWLDITDYQLDLTAGGAMRENSVPRPDASK